MSYEKCKTISLKPKTNQIFINIASNNVRPLYYSRCEYASKNNCSFDDKLLYLMISMLDGNIQISQLNKSTIPFEYALLKLRNYYRENDINEYGSKYDKRHELFDKELSKYVDMENWEEKSKFCKNNKELVDSIEITINKELYKIEFELFKNAIKEEIREKFYLMDDYGKIVKFISETSRGYKYRVYGKPNKDCILDYKLAYIRKEQMGARYKLCKYEKILEYNNNMEDEEEFE